MDEYGTHTPHFAAPVFSSCNRTQCSASGSAAAIFPSASLLGGSSLHSAMSSALLGKSSLPPLSSGSSAGAEEAVAFNAPRRADRSSDRVVEALTGIRIVAGKQGLVSSDPLTLQFVERCSLFDDLRRRVDSG